MIKIPSLLKTIFPSKIRFDNPDSGKKIYLTFDDGPTPELTGYIVETLKKYNAGATFFCVGENIIKSGPSFELLKQSNFSIGNHTYNHLNGWKTPNSSYFDNIEKFNLIYKTNLFRPPYGKIRYSQIRNISRNYKIYLWSVISYDFDKNTSPERCLRNVIENVYDGSIIVFHDNIKAEKNLLYALPRTLDFLQKQNYIPASLQ